MNMSILAVVTPPSIYHTYYTQKKFWEEIFTGEGNFTLGEFIDVIMKKCGCCNDRKYKNIKDSDKHIILEILLKFGSLDNMRTTSSEPKHNLVISGKGLITSLGLKSKSRRNKY